MISFLETALQPERQHHLLHLAIRVRSGVRNRFLASCCVIVEPPCDTPRWSTLATSARNDAERIDAEME